MNFRPRSMGGGDASQRSPASGGYPLGGGSWSAAAAAVAATHAAAVSCSTPVAVPCVVGTQAAAVSCAMPVAVVCVTKDTSPLNQAAMPRTAGMEVCPADSLKCWLAGVSEDSMPSAEDLLERLLQQCRRPMTIEALEVLPRKSTGQMQGQATAADETSQSDLVFGPVLRGVLVVQLVRHPPSGSRQQSSGQ